ncbi:hypothetical protein IQ07DRAFT_104975 [Pyrenochaeta sp. DS3sAY3a]|nr:hypothetical protein IQ07DRAFT_104975 [Pyrenochaeta sp. DS3sAY3a]
MKSTLILALSSTAVALPFADVVDAVFGTHQARHIPPPDQMPRFHPIASGSGTGFPCPTATGDGAFPTASGSLRGFPFPQGSRPGPHQHRSRSLAIDYQLAPTASAIPPNRIKRQELEGSGSTLLPSFTLLDPSGTEGVPAPTAVPTEEPDSPFPAPTEDPDSPFPFPTGAPELPFPTGAPDSPFPTGGFPLPTGDFPLPTGGFPLPTGGFPGFPGTGLPSLPTTLETVTRGPRPTAQPELPELPQIPGLPDLELPSLDDPQGWLDFLTGLFGNGRSEMSN